MVPVYHPSHGPAGHRGQNFIKPTTKPFEQQRILQARRHFRHSAIRCITALAYPMHSQNPDNDAQGVPTGHQLCPVFVGVLLFPHRDALADRPRRSAAESGRSVSSECDGGTFLPHRAEAGRSALLALPPSRHGGTAPVAIAISRDMWNPRMQWGGACARDPGECYSQIISVPCLTSYLGRWLQFLIDARPFRS